MTTLVTDEQLQNLFESFDNAIKWRDMDIYELNRRGYMVWSGHPMRALECPS